MEDGKSLDVKSLRDGGEYCGYFWNFYEKKTIFIPYKRLPDGKVKYWTSPELFIIGSDVGLNHKLNDAVLCSKCI